MASGLRDRGAPPAGPPTRPGAGALDLAVVVATAGDEGPAGLAPLDGGTVLGRLAGQLAAAGARRTVILTRPGWEDAVREAVPGADVRAPGDPARELAAIAALAREATGPLLLCYGDIVAHQGALDGLVADPRGSSVILAGGRRRATAFRIQARRGRVVGAATPYHAVRRPNGSFLGVARVAPADAAALADAAERLAPLVADPPPAWREELGRKAARWRAARAEEPEGDADDVAAEDAEEELPEASAVVLAPEEEAVLRGRLEAAPHDVVALLLVGLVRGGAPVYAVFLRRLFWARALSAEAAERAGQRLRELDEDRLLLDSAVKSVDGFFTTYFVSPYSRFIARWAARRGLTPNQVTTASMAIGLLAAAAFATGDRWGLVAGAVLLQAAFTADCVDGQLARYTRRYSKFGAWLDSVFDRAKEYVVFAGLAIGASAAGDPVWLLACAALALQAIRHLFGSAWAYHLRRGGGGGVRHPPLEQPLDAAGVAAEARRAAGAAPPPRSPAARAIAQWGRLDAVPAMVWAKRLVAFPIGERFAVISITAALFTPRVTFVALLTWNGLGFVYTQSARLLRTLR